MASFVETFKRLQRQGDDGGKRKNVCRLEGDSASAKIVLGVVTAAERKGFYFIFIMGVKTGNIKITVLYKVFTSL